MTIDELLKAHPAPFRAIPLYGHYGQPQFQVCDKDGYSIAHAWGQDAQDICDAMNELVRLREEVSRITENPIVTVVDGTSLDLSQAEYRLAHALHRTAQQNTELATLRARVAEQEQELVRLRDDRLRALTQYAKKAEYLRAITTLRARNAELEAFAARMRETPRRVCEALHTMSKSAFVYDVEGEDDEDAEGEDDEDAEEMCSEDTINYIADEFRVGKHNAAIFGEGPLPWDEKGGGA